MVVWFLMVTSKSAVDIAFGEMEVKSQEGIESSCAQIQASLFGFVIPKRGPQISKLLVKRLQSAPVINNEI